MRTSYLFIFITTILMGLTNAFASEVNPCINYAKAAAIRAYHADMGVVQGSPGITYSANQVYLKGEFSRYIVTIEDGNEDGDFWTSKYLVTMRGAEKNCRVLAVKPIND